MSSINIPLPSSMFGSGELSESKNEMHDQVFKDFNLDEESFDRNGVSLNRSGGGSRDVLGSLLQVGQWLGSEDVVHNWSKVGQKLPRAGDDVMGFRLVRELGRGAFARVFLAEQTALADRRVAVKVSQAPRDESQTLAQLQHTHIVPIYSAHVDPTTGFRMLVMPYFGGTTLDRLLAKAGRRADPQATGRGLMTALDGLATCDYMSRPGGSTRGPNSQSWSDSLPSRLPSLGASQQAIPWMPSRLLGRNFLGAWREPMPAASAIGQSARHLLERSSYIQAVIWIAARLAEALAHAHQRGILHRDIKPSNVLIAADGQPMLLDFNLACDLKSNDSGAVAYVGGTLPYMAPEHLDAFNVLNQTPPTAVDERCDIYSLGVVLFEMLTSKHPFRLEPPGESLPGLLERMAAERRAGVPSARDSNPAVPRSLNAIIQRCLEPDPAKRYPEAAHLAEDLQRELDSLPLRHTTEPSWSERARKWMRRHPRLSSAGSIATISILAVAGLIGLVLIVGGKLAGYDAERRWVKFQEGLVRTQLLVHTGREPGQNLEEGQKVCEQTLAMFDVLEDKDWLHESRVARLSAKNRTRLPEDATELLILMARVRAEQARLAKSAKIRSALLENAVQMLNRAEHFQSANSPRSLYEDRSEYHRLLGDVDGADADWSRAQETPLRTARDHYLFATSLAVEKHHEAAIQELEIALRLDPKHFWSHFTLGICFDQLGRYAEAVAAYGAPIALWPEFPWTYLNRGLARSRLGRWEEAIQDYSDAVRHDPHFGDAFVNRGVAYLNRHRYAEAIADFSHVLEMGRDGGNIRAARAAAFAGLGEYDSASSDFELALRATPGDESILLSRGFALARHDPQQSLGDFDRVLSRQPQSARAHFGRAFVLGEILGRTAEAIEAAENALSADSRFVAARSELALFLARAGETQRALCEAESALEQERNGPVLFTAACTYAIAGRNDPELANRAFELLQQALKHGYGRDEVQSDADLESLRQDPRFAQLAVGTP